MQRTRAAERADDQDHQRQSRMNHRRKNYTYRQQFQWEDDFLDEVRILHNQQRRANGGFGKDSKSDNPAEHIHGIDHEIFILAVPGRMKNNMKDEGINEQSE